MEIKCRAYDRETEEFIYSTGVGDENGWFEFTDGRLKAYAIHGMTPGSLDEPPQPNCEELEKPELFTGLHVKNGKEVYEGDIIKIRCENDYMMNDDCFYIKTINDWAYLWNNRDIFVYEILGNRWENPELLEGE